MTTTDRIINDSALFSMMKNDKPDIFEDLTIEELKVYMSIFGKPELNDIIMRIISLYEGVYPTPEDKETLIQLIRDLDILGSGKRVDLLVLLHHYYPDDIVQFVETSSQSIKDCYEQIEFGKTLRQTLMANDLLDLFKIKFNDFVVNDLAPVIYAGSLKIFQYLWETIGTEHMIDEMFSDLGKNRLNILKYIFDVILKDDIEKTKRYLHGEVDKGYNLLLREACADGDLELVQWLWNFSCQEGIGKLDLHADDEEPLRAACGSEDIELVQWIWDTCIKEGNKIDLMKEYYQVVQNGGMDGHVILLESILINECRESNMPMVYFMYNLALKDGISVNMENLPDDVAEEISLF